MCKVPHTGCMLLRKLAVTLRAHPMGFEGSTIWLAAEELKLL